MLEETVVPVPFQPILRSIKSPHEGLHNHLAFVFSALSLARTQLHVKESVDLAACCWENIFAIASNGLVAPLLYRRIRQKQLEAYCPSDFVEALQVIHQANANRNAVQREILLQVLRVLNREGITPVLLKGAHALMGLMPDHQERIISDIDLLILDEQVLKAKAILLAAGFFQKDADHEADANVNHHHLAPLYHPSLNGYVELHRFPHYAPHYPQLIPECFVPDKLLYGAHDEARFYYQHPWQLLLYNQIHHYHSCLNSFRLDMRHMAEQAALVSDLNTSVDLEAKVLAVFGKRKAHAQLQFLLLQELFEQPLPVPLQASTPPMRKQVRDVLAKLLANPAAIAKQRRIVVWSMFTYMLKQLGNKHWLKQRLFNLAWYQSRADVIRGVLRSGTKLDC